MTNACRKTSRRYERQWLDDLTDGTVGQVIAVAGIDWWKVVHHNDVSCIEPPMFVKR